MTIFISASSLFCVATRVSFFSCSFLIIFLSPRTWEGEGEEVVEEEVVVEAVEAVAVEAEEAVAVEAEEVKAAAAAQAEAEEEVEVACAPRPR